MSKNDKIVKYPKLKGLNVGVIVFILIILYVSVNVIIYVTSDKVSVYEVQQGSIASNNVYKGLILRDEEVIYSDNAGYINYFYKAGQKASVNDMIYSVDTNGDLSKKINGTDALLTSNELKELSDNIDAFTSNFHNDDFHSLYSFKNNTESFVAQAISMNAYEALAEQIVSAETNQTFYAQKAIKPGLVLYYIDGYEGLTKESVTAASFDTSNYAKQVLNTRESIQSGDAAYKLVCSEEWSIIIPISTYLAEELSMDDVIKIRFCSDEKTAVCTYTISKIENGYYLNLNLTNSMIRYSNDRFVNIELILDNKNGLKIPNTSIVSKEFLTLPKDLFYGGADNTEPSLLIRTTVDGNTSDNLVSPNIYFETSEYYYVDPKEIASGSLALYPDSTKTYLVGDETSSLTGVYNINKGYAIFRQINILYQNDEYSIVETGTSYGITVYDHIALDGSTISENQLVAQ